ncbi:MAG: hypothetical protein CFE24_15095 [Flavobacterium sp. BFFFF2]|nr:MAG: hypothetical protein CFE24_15095 [Flavobacterium sp. BFFFF2]
MENITPERRQEIIKNLENNWIKNGCKCIKGAWFINENEFNFTKNKQPEIYQNIEFKTAPVYSKY